MSDILVPKYASLGIVDAGQIARNVDPTKHTNETINFSYFKTVAEAVGFTVAHETMVLVGPHAYGGNHIHRRQEFQVAVTGNPIFMYRKEEGGDIIEVPMGRDEDGNLKAIIVPEFLPHVVINPGDEPAGVFEYYDLAPDPTAGDFRKLTPEESLLPAALANNL